MLETRTFTVHRFSGTDPWTNLAREECWFDDLAPGASALLLYVNSPCVVLGKHQNPLREVRLEEAARRSIPLVRRSSGGGTVYQDGGNLNWSFLVSKEGYDRSAVSETVVRALAKAGVSLTAGEKGDLFWREKKVSGAAYLFRRDKVLHHGTLLCDARLDDLRGVLGPTGTLTEWVGVASRPQPVTNLGIGVDAAAEALAAGAAVGDGRGDAAFEARVAALARQRKAAEWTWDQTPPFTWEGQTSRGWMRVKVKNGVIEEAWDDTNLNLSKIPGNRIFQSEFFSYLSREVV